MPYRLAFEEVEYFDAWAIVELMIDALFFMDIIVNFISAYASDDGEEVCDFKTIAIGYMRTWFVLDLLSCFPFGLVEYAMEDGETNNQSSSARYNTLIRLIRLPRLYKLLRIARLAKMFKHFKEWEVLSKLNNLLKINPRIFKLVKFMLSVGCCVHITACLWYFCAKLEYFGPQTWVVRYGYLDQEDGASYLAAIYWSFTVVTTVGFGDIVAKTDLEIILNIFWMILGVGFYSFTVSSLTSLLTQADSRETILNSKLEAVKLFGEETSIEPDVALKMKEAIKYNTHKVAASSDKNTLFSEIPKGMRYEVVCSMYNGIALEMGFFRNRQNAFTVAVMPLLKPQHVFDREYLFQEWDHPDDVYFITKGRVYLVIGKFPYKTFLRGSYIGEIELILKSRRLDTAMVIGHSEFLTLEKQDFYYILNEFPEDARGITQVALERRKRNLHNKNKLLSVLEKNPKYHMIILQARDQFNLFNPNMADDRNEVEQETEQQKQGLLRKQQFSNNITQVNNMANQLTDKVNFVESKLQHLQRLIAPIKTSIINNQQRGRSIEALLSRNLIKRKRAGKQIAKEKILPQEGEKLEMEEEEKNQKDV